MHYALIFVLLSGCDWLKRTNRTSSNPTTTASQTGDLGTGTFSYVCLTPVDVGCSKSSELPSVAVGAFFDLSYSSSSTSLVPVGVHADLDGIGYRVNRPSYVAFLAAQRTDSRVEDFVHVSAETPTKLRVFHGTTEADAMTLQVEETAAIYLRASSASSTDLAGMLVGEWTSSDPAVVDFEKDDDAVVNLVAKSAGTATVTGTFGGLQTQTLVVEVTL